MLKGLFVALAAAATVLAVQMGPQGGAGAPGAGDAGATPSHASAPFRDAGLRVIVSPDGGPTYLGDPPGQILRADDEAAGDRSAAADDAGPADSGVPAGELQDLRSRIAALEQQLARARAASQTEQLQTLNGQLAALRAQLAQDQALREARAAAAQDAIVQTQEAVTALSAAERELAFGNSQVLDTLDFAYPALPFPAQRAVQNARRAIQSEDLAGARYWLSVAIAEAQGTELRY